MSNFDVNRVGIKIATDTLRKKGHHVNTENGVCITHEDICYPAMIWTKVHQERAIGPQNAIHSITGKDEKQIARISKNAFDHGDVWLIFVDAKLGVIKGGLYSQLTKPKEFEGLEFPYTEITHSGKIVYFNIYLIPTLAEIDEDDLNQLRDEIIHNRAPEGQGFLF